MRNSFLSLLLTALYPLLLSDAQAADGSVVKAGRMIAEEKCAQCHAIGLVGESTLEVAPPFRRVLERHPLSDSRAFTEDLAKEHLQMPPFAFTRKEAAALLAYMKSLKNRSM